MALPTPESIEGLREELTIQQVMLESLRDAEFDGVHQERELAMREVARLTHALKKALTMRTRVADQGSQASSATLSGSPVGSPFVSQTALSEQNSETMEAGSQRSNELALPERLQTSTNRKRDYDPSTFLSPTGRSKSRKTTPTPRNGHASPFSDFGTGDLEVIDLTGDDVDLHSTLIADQIRQEEMVKKEREDHELALLLSSQDSEHPGVAPIFDPGASSANAFSRLMSTQMANAPGPSSVKLENREPFTVEVPDSTAAFASSSHSMPGAYDSRWDEATKSRQPINAMHSNHRPTPALLMPGTSSRMTPACHAQSMDSRLQYPYSVPGRYPHVASQSGPGTPVTPTTWGRTTPQGSPLAGFNRPSVPLGSSAASILQRAASYLPSPSGGSSALSRIINQTSMFGAPIDPNNPPHMSDRLATYLDGAYHDPRVTDKELDELLQNIRPDMEIPKEKRGNTPEALKQSLYYHQELALTWMQQMEDGTNKGGVLADDMGLGKTISTLALIHTRKATSRPKTNLIIGHLSLVRQWEEEIRTKTKVTHRLSVFVYHNKKVTTDELLKYDIVLTTYGTLAQELKRKENFIKDNADRKIDYNERTVALKFPLLHPTKAVFFRVILDEAQCIKNKETQTSKACHALKATYRWCLTGTPMMNGVLELFPLLRFLKIKPYCEWEKFRKSFGVLFGRNGDSKSVAMTRLRALLKAIMLRRKKDSQLDGKPILILPPKTEELVYATFSDDETSFYKQLEQKSQVQFSKYLREGSIGKNYSNILVLLLRLRQACCHPHLNLDVDDVNPMTDENIEDLIKQLDPSIVERIKSIEAFECPICYDVVQSPSFFIPCGHDSCRQCLTRLADNATTMNIQEGHESDRAKCPVCRSPFDPRKCFSYEAFQKAFMPETIKGKEECAALDSSTDETSSEAEDSSEDDVDERGNLKDFVVDDGHLSEGSDEGSNAQDENDTELTIEKFVKRTKKDKGKAKKEHSNIRPSMLKQLRLEAAKNRVAYKRYMRYLRKTWEPAAKVTECMRLLKESEEAGAKAIIFSQWTLLLDLIEVAMGHENFANKPKRYDGSMSGELRSSAAKEFRDNKNVTVMLVSLRAGNAGLNLTSATRVIIMDPFWNPYIEMQAVDRAYRIGQQHEVKVYRILTKDTVEDRIVELKKKKQEIVEAALDEKESAKIGRLNVSELKFLFHGHGNE